MDHNVIPALAQHRALAERTKAPGDQKRALVLNLLAGTGLLKTEEDRVAAGLVIDALSWAAKNGETIYELTCGARTSGGPPSRLRRLRCFCLRGGG